MKAVRLYNEWKKYTFHFIMAFTFPFPFKMSVNWSLKVLICFRNSQVMGLVEAQLLYLPTYLEYIGGSTFQEC